MTGVACDVLQPRIQLAPALRADARECEEGFAADHPLLGRHLAEQCREASTIAVEGEPRFLVFVDANRTLSGVDTYLGLPCYR